MGILCLRHGDQSEGVAGSEVSRFPAAFPQSDFAPQLLPPQELWGGRIWEEGELTEALHDQAQRGEGTYQKSPSKSEEEPGCFLEGVAFWKARSLLVFIRVFMPESVSLYLVLWLASYFPHIPLGHLHFLSSQGMMVFEGLESLYARHRTNAIIKRPERGEALGCCEVWGDGMTVWQGVHAGIPKAPGWGASH